MILQIIRCFFDTEFYQTKTGITVITVVGATLVIVLLVLIAVVAVSYRKRGSQSSKT